MAVPELHRYPALWLPNVVPSIPVEVNASHPLAPLALYLPGIGQKDLCGNFPSLTFTSPTTFRSDPSGASIGGFVAKSGGATVVGTAQQLTGSVTIFWRGTIAGAPIGGNCPIIGLVTASNASPFGSYSIWSSATTFQPEGFWNSGGTAIRGGPGVAFPTNSDISCVMTFVPGGNVTTYINGKKVGSTVSFGALSPTYATTYDFVVGGPQPSVSGHAINGSTYAGMIYNRALSPAEIMQLYLQPYSMLRPIVRRVRAAAVHSSVSVSLAGLSATTTLGSSLTVADIPGIVGLHGTTLGASPMAADVSGMIGLQGTTTLGMLQVLSHPTANYGRVAFAPDIEVVF